MSEEQETVFVRVQETLQAMWAELGETLPPAPTPPGPDEHWVSRMVYALLLHLAEESVSPSGRYTGPDVDPFKERIRHLRSVAAETLTLPQMLYRDEAGFDAEGDTLEAIRKMGVDLTKRLSEKLEEALETAQQPVVAPSP